MKRRLASLSSIALVAWVFAACDTGGSAELRGAAEPTAPTAPSGPQVGGAAATADDGGAPASPSHPDSGVPAEPEETVPAVRFVGRFDTRDPAGPLCGFPGCRIVARFQGTQVAARLDDRVDDWMVGGPSEWDVSIDGSITKKLVLQRGAHAYELATGLPPGVHTVELYKRSEAQNGVTRFLSFDFGGGTLLPPPNRAKRRIEVVGDSTPAAFGIEGTSFHGNGDCPEPMHAAKFQNFHKSFAAALGEIFDAELFGTVYSGKGLVRNIWRPDTETMPKLFGRANPVDPTSTFDLSTAVPDVVVLSIGGLDFAYGKPYDDGPTPLDQWVTAYEALAARMRAAYPNAWMFALVSPSLKDDFPPDRAIRTTVTNGLTQVVQQRVAKGDQRIELVVPPVATDAELTGCAGHGNPQMHQRLAQDLSAVIRVRTGW